MYSSNELPVTRIVVGFIIICALIAGLVLFSKVRQISAIDSFEACLKAGNPVMETHPRQCAANGQLYVEQ